jgi:hypothetical protein
VAVVRIRRSEPLVGVRKRTICTSSGHVHVPRWLPLHRAAGALRPLNRLHVHHDFAPVGQSRCKESATAEYRALLTITCCSEEQRRTVPVRSANPKGGLPAARSELSSPQSAASYARRRTAPSRRLIVPALNGETPSAFDTEVRRPC